MDKVKGPDNKQVASNKQITDNKQMSHNNQMFGIEKYDDIRKSIEEIDGGQSGTKVIEVFYKILNAMKNDIMDRESIINTIADNFPEEKVQNIVNQNVDVKVPEYLKKYEIKVLAEIGKLFDQQNKEKTPENDVVVKNVEPIISMLYKNEKPK